MRSREGGISWSESVIVDGDGSGRTQEQARTEDTERRWEDLVDDSSWHHEVGMGGFSFLDPIGFRYYIAPAMIRCIREGGGEFISYALTVDGDFKEERVSLITADQANAIARFVRLMIAVHAAVGDDIYGKPWSPRTNRIGGGGIGGRRLGDRGQGGGGPGGTVGSLASAAVKRRDEGQKRGILLY